jgi:hypothetical protein
MMLKIQSQALLAYCRSEIYSQIEVPPAGQRAHQENHAHPCGGQHFFMVPRENL